MTEVEIKEVIDEGKPSMIVIDKVDKNDVHLEHSSWQQVESRIPID